MTGAMVSRPLDPKDVRSGMLYVGQLNDRTLRVAVARFVDQLSASLVQQYDVSL
jgi:hypothetical protein